MLEPLLFALLCPSVLKFQMIGDHLQLQPGIQQKFEFERMNNVGVSMFERLILAPRSLAAHAIQQASYTHTP